MPIGAILGGLTEAILRAGAELLRMRPTIMVVSDANPTNSYEKIPVFSKAPQRGHQVFLNLAVLSDFNESLIGSIAHAMRMRFVLARFA